MVKRYVILLVVSVILGIVIYGLLTEKSSIVTTALRWSNLAPLPKNAQILSANSEGGLSWRGYRVRFSASQQEIKQWLAESRGIKSAVVSAPSRSVQVIGAEVIQPHNTTRYIILDTAPGIGHAEVNIGKDGETVEIYTFNT